MKIESNLSGGKGKIIIRILIQYYGKQKQKLLNIKLTCMEKINGYFFKQLCIALFFAVTASAHNYIQNGNFEFPLLCPTCQQQSDSLGPWAGRFQLFGTDYAILQWPNQTQYIRLRVNQWGWMIQTIILPSEGLFNLAFKTISLSTNDAIQVYWNDQLISNVTPSIINVFNEHSFQVKGTMGLNNLIFIDKMVNVGILSTGILLDDVSLIEVPTPTPAPNYRTGNKKLPFFQKILRLVKKIVPLPLNHMKLSSLSLFLEDLWLYTYSHREYFGTISKVFEGTQQLEALKWKIFNYTLIIKVASLQISSSNYSLFSNQKHLEVDKIDDVMLKNLHLFLIFTTPQTLILCFVLRKIFIKISKSSSSVIFRRFYFLIGSITQILFEGNLSYFSYLGFNQIKISFFFLFFDKLMYSGAVILIWMVIVFGIAYYYIINAMYGSRAGYFIHDCYRTLAGLTFLTIRVGFRMLLKGVIFSLLHHHYAYQIASLTFLELCNCLLTVVMEPQFKIFMLKVKVCHVIIYHSLLVALNLALYFEWKHQECSEIVEICLELQGVIIIVLSIVVALDIICTFVKLGPKRKVFNAFGSDSNIVSRTQIRISSRFKLLKSIPNAQSTFWQPHAQVDIPDFSDLTQ